MDELIKLVAQKVGIPEAQAKQAVDTVLTFLKGKLPAGVASQIDGVLSGQAAGGVLGGIGNILGKK